MLKKSDRLFPVPSAASFYVSHMPDLHGDDVHPLHIYAGYLPSDPDAATAPETSVTAHLYFVLVKARRTADRERLLFWFNVRPHCTLYEVHANQSSGWTRVLLV